MRWGSWGYEGGVEDRVVENVEGMVVEVRGEGEEMEGWEEGVVGVEWMKGGGRGDGEEKGEVVVGGWGGGVEVDGVEKRSFEEFEGWVCGWWVLGGWGGC